jgi:hypothetical protein
VIDIVAPPYPKGSADGRRQMKCLQKIQELQLRLQEMSTQCAEKEALRLEAHRAGTYLIYRFLLKNEISTVKLHLAFFEI